MADTEGSGSGNFFERAYGGLPMYAWIAIGVGGLLVFQAYRSQNSTSSTAPPPNSGTGSGIAPYMVLLPQGPVAPTPASNTVASVATTAAPPAPNMSAFGFTWTPYRVLGLQPSRGVQADTSPIGIAQIAYGLDKGDTANAAYLASLITTNNPGIDWAKPLDTGTVVMVPQLDVVPPGGHATQFN